MIRKYHLLKAKHPIELQYNPCTGEFKPSGSKRKDGYIMIGPELAHRIGWKLTYGKTAKELDHIDGNPTNNSIWNLREVDHQQNLLNSKFHRNGGKSRRSGHWHPRRYYLTVRS